MTRRFVLPWTNGNVGVTTVGMVATVDKIDILPSMMAANGFGKEQF